MYVKYCLWCKCLCSIISTYWGLMCWLWIKPIYLEGCIIRLSKSVRNIVNHSHVVFLCSVSGTMLTASQTISYEHTNSAGESHVSAIFRKGNSQRSQLSWYTDPEWRSRMQNLSVWTHTWATGHHALETCMWSVSWPPQPLGASSRVVSPDGELASLPKQDWSPATAWCQFPPHTILSLCTDLLNNHWISRTGSGNQRVFISSFYCLNPKYATNAGWSQMGNNIFLKIGLEILIQSFKMFPFSGISGWVTPGR